MMPHTVPNSPTKGVTAPVIASHGTLRSKRVNSFAAYCGGQPVWVQHCLLVRAPRRRMTSRINFRSGPLIIVPGGFQFTHAEGRSLLENQYGYLETVLRCRFSCNFAFVTPFELSE